MIVSSVFGTIGYDQAVKNFQLDFFTYFKSSLACFCKVVSLLVIIILFFIFILEGKFEKNNLKIDYDKKNKVVNLKLTFAIAIPSLH